MEKQEFENNMMSNPIFLAECILKIQDKLEGSMKTIAKQLQKEYYTYKDQDKIFTRRIAQKNIEKIILENHVEIKQTILKDTKQFGIEEDYTMQEVENINI